MNEVSPPTMDRLTVGSPQDDSMAGIRVSYYQCAMERKLRKAGISLGAPGIIARPVQWQRGARIDWIAANDDELEALPEPTPKIAARRNLLRKLADRIGKHFRQSS